MPHNCVSSAPRPSRVVTMRRNRMARRRPSQVFGIARVSASAKRSSAPGARLPYGERSTGTASAMDDAKRGKPAHRAHAAGAHYRVEPRSIGGQSRAVAFRVPEVEHAGRKTSVLALDAGMDEPDREIGILQPPAVVARIEPVDAVEIGACDREIACARALPALRFGLAQRPERKIQRGPRTVDAAAAHERREAPLLGLELAREYVSGQRLRQQDAIARDEPAGLGERTVPRNEVIARNAIAVEENAIAA